VPPIPVQEKPGADEFVFPHRFWLENEACQVNILDAEYQFEPEQFQTSGQRMRAVGMTLCEEADPLGKCERRHNADGRQGKDTNAFRFEKVDLRVVVPLPWNVERVTLRR
jgi:hypothetical protein